MLTTRIIYFSQFEPLLHNFSLTQLYGRTLIHFGERPTDEMHRVTSDSTCGRENSPAPSSPVELEGRCWEGPEAGATGTTRGAASLPLGGARGPQM